MNITPIETPVQLVLTDEQQSAIDKIKEWLIKGSISPQEFKLGGYAGTGKTTVIKALIEQLAGKAWFGIAAFTGKATNVLQRKGLHGAQTLHSLMYDVVQEVGQPIEFVKKAVFEERFDCIIVDEASMLNTQLLEDLKSFRKKILFVGDPGQLEPVGDNPRVMERPDYVLSKIHRQAELSPIITFASDIRHGGRPMPKDVTGDHGTLVVRSKSGFTIPQVEDMKINQVICAKNKTRQEINILYRRFLNRPTDDLIIGDKLICLRNNQQVGVFNGMILYVKDVRDKQDLYWEVNLEDEVGKKFTKVNVWREPFEKELPKEFTIPKVMRVPLLYVEWGYCITCHKSQGSEWENVLVWDENVSFFCNQAKWRYTAITRASQKLVFCL